MRAPGNARCRRASSRRRSARTPGERTVSPRGSTTTGSNGAPPLGSAPYRFAMAAFVAQPSLWGTEGSFFSASDAGPMAATPAIVMRIQQATTVGLCPRTQRASEDMERLTRAAVGTGGSQRVVGVDSGVAVGHGRIVNVEPEYG